MYKTCTKYAMLTILNNHFNIPAGGFGVEKVFLFLCAGTLLDLLLADLLADLSVSSSPFPVIKNIDY